MANVITAIRLALLFLLVALAYWASPRWQLVDAPLLLLIIALDGLDGYVARARGETSAFGALFDIAVDRVVENVLWVVLAHLGFVPVWVAFVFIARGAIVDAIRYAGMAEGLTPYGAMRSPWGRFLVASRFMRGAYGTLKAATFGWIFLVQPLPALDPALWARWSEPAETLTRLLVLATVAFCLARGLPVVVEFVLRSAVFGRAFGPSPGVPSRRLP